MAEVVMCKPLTDDSTSSTSSVEGSPVLKKAKVCTDSHSPITETAKPVEMAKFVDEDVYDEYDFSIYLRHIFETEGFYVDMNLRPGFAFGIIRPISVQCYETLEQAKTAVCIAVDRYNADPEVSSKLEFIKIIRANECKDMFYVTFKAKSVSYGKFQTYQTQVFYRPLTGNLDIDFEVLIFRPEPEHFKQYVQDGDAPREDGDACGI